MLYEIIALVFALFCYFCKSFNKDKELFMKYKEIHFLITPYLEDAADLLMGWSAEAGLESFVAHENGFKGYAQSDLLDLGMLDCILRDFPFEDIRISYTVSDAEDKNWNEEWEKTGFTPILIADKVLIHATYHNELPEAAHHILINPRQSFGTGSHQTTGMIVERLLHMDVSGLRILDAGCGTGILGIFAAMRGAKEVVAYDIDEWSVNNTLENAALNQVTTLQVLHGDATLVEGLGTFDIVLANINRNILLQDMPIFARAMKPGSRLILSGFYREDIELLKEKAQSLGLTLINMTEKDRWVSLLFER